MWFRRCPKPLKLVFQQIMKMETQTDPTPASNKSISEGQAHMSLTSEKVFYNPVQEFNRDLSIAVLTVFTGDYKAEKQAKREQKLKNKKEQGVESSIEDTSEIDVTILEALSATGLRSIRYAKEVPNVTKIVANDLSQKAVETIQANIVHNKVEHLIDTNHDDACMLMYKHKHPSLRFSAIDLDPYGCPSIFLDSAVQAVQDGGMLLVTATDMAVLAGNSPETCYCKYGAVSLKTKSCHEMALRILLQCIEQHANRYSRYIVPLLSISADFYIRVFVKVYSGAVHCKKTTSKLSMVYQCVGCDNLTLQPLGAFKPNPSEKNPSQTKAYLPPAPSVAEHCVHCNQRHHLGGPIWSAPIHDESFVSRVLTHVQDHPDLFGTSKRIRGMLSVIREELADAPLYYTLDKLFGRVHLETMPMMIMRSAIMNAGYKVSYSHASKLSIKTQAPARLLWDIIRTWEKTHPVKPANHRAITKKRGLINVDWGRQCSPLTSSYKFKLLNARGAVVSLASDHINSTLEADQVAKYLLTQPIEHTVDLTERQDANPISRRDGCLRFQFNPAPYWGPGSRAAVNVGEEKMSKAIKNQNKHTKTKTKREHSPQSDEEARKKQSHEQTEG